MENIEIQDEVFEKLKLSLLDEIRLLKKFKQFCIDYNDFEYDEIGMNMEESEDILRKAYKIRDKFLSTVETKCLYKFNNIETDVLTNIIKFDLESEKLQCKVKLDISEDSFNLEII